MYDAGHEDSEQNSYSSPCHVGAKNLEVASTSVFDWNGEGSFKHIVGIRNIRFLLEILFLSPSPNH